MPTGVIEKRSIGEGQTLGHRLCAAAHILWRSVNPSPENAWRTDAQIRLMRSGTRFSTLIISVAAFLVQLAFRPWVDPVRRYAWWIGVAVLCVAVDRINRRIDRIPARNASLISRKAKLSVAFSIVFYLAWCSMGIVFWVPGQPEAQMLLVLILACSLAGSTVICAAHPATALCALAIHAVALVPPTIFGGTSLDTTLAALSAIFIFLIGSQLIGLNGGMKRALDMEHERGGLVRNLRQAKRDSDRERGRAVMAGEAKSQFLSNMNHELRTPMNAILGFSELIKIKAFGSDVDKYAEYAVIIHDSGQHLLTLIDGMLDLAKIEGGKLSLREIEIDVHALIDEAIEAQAPLASQTRLTVSSDVERGLPKIYADERGIRQIVTNLLSNAIKFTQAEGAVTVFARSIPDGRLVFGVSDTGKGIAPEDQPHVFERFGKRPHQLATDHKGTGLGLAIVKGFADAHDGSVELASTVGAGTRVTVYMPAERVIARYNARAYV